MAQKLKFRPRSRRGIGSAIVVIAVALALGGGAWFIAMAAPPIPVLLQAPPKGESPQPDWFAQRLKERFPAGASEADLLRELWLERFLPRTNRRAERRTAGFEAQKDAFRKCRLVANVSWTADDKGLLTGIEGDYSDICQ